MLSRSHIFYPFISRYFRTLFHAFLSLLKSLIYLYLLSLSTALLLISLWKKNSVTYYCHIYIPADTCACGSHFPELPLFLYKTIPSICPLDFIPCCLFKDMLLFLHQLNKKIRTRQNKNRLMTLFVPLSRYHSNLFPTLEIKLCEVFA